MSDLSALAVADYGSLFDQLRREDENGEYWSARDLMAPLGYATWENFAEAIDRAKVAACNSGYDCEAMFVLVKNFRDATKVVRGPAGADYRLTRFAAYLLAMNGDPRKMEVSAAQSYFAIKTRQAEIGQTLPVTMRNPALQQIVEMAVQMQITQDEQARLDREQKTLALEQRVLGGQVAVLAGELADVRELVPHLPTGEGLTVRSIAKLLKINFNDLHQWLRDSKITFYDRPHGEKKRGIQPYKDWEDRGWAYADLDPTPIGDITAPYFTETGFAELKRRLRADGMID